MDLELDALNRNTAVPIVVHRWRQDQHRALDTGKATEAISEQNSSIFFNFSIYNDYPIAKFLCDPNTANFKLNKNLQSRICPRVTALYNIISKHVVIIVIFRVSKHEGVVF